MSDAKFTPSPWNVVACSGWSADKDTSSWSGWSQIESFGRTICLPVESSDDVSDEEEYKANIGLIAAAPDMYCLLERLKSECEMFYSEFGEPSDPDYEAAFTEAEKLLAKARGK